MKQADASERSRCTEGAAPSGVSGMPQRMIVCTNTTPAQFAERLHGMSPQYANRPVVDGTGIDGAFDFSVTYSTVRAVQAAIHRGDGEAGDGEPDSTEPSGVTTLFEALEKQTGLKVVTEKRRCRC